MSETIERAETAADVAAVKTLFRAYAESLDFSLCFQDFEAEMADFPGRYGGPGGCLLLARSGDRPVGAVGLWPLRGNVCEMKRMYVLPEARGAGLGRRLAVAIIAEGRRLGYRAMRLDTVPRLMAPAVALYRELGFREIPAYTHNPIEGAIYMELDLGTGRDAAAGDRGGREWRPIASR